MLLPARKPVLIAATAAVAVLLVLGLLLAGDHGPTALDQSVFDAVEQNLRYRLLRLLKAPTNPMLLVAVLAVVAVVALAARRVDLAVLAVTGPGLSVLLASFVLKPLFGRRYYGSYLAYPSGHTTALTSTLLVVLIGVALLHRPVLTAVVAVLELLVLAAAVIGLIGLRYHYLTDTFGGICVAGATVVAVGSVVDSGRTWRTRRDQRRHPVHSMQ